MIKACLRFLRIGAGLERVDRSSTVFLREIPSEKNGL